jgi:hypothetical protein
MKQLEWKNAWLAFFISMPLLFTDCSKDKSEDVAVAPVVIAGTGDINPMLDEFRSLLGGQLNTTPGATEGRREINWDGVPDHMLDQKLPEDFFNPTAPEAPVANQRGLRYSANGNFQVSKTNFAAVNPEAAGEFNSFSGTKSFANVSASQWDVEFQVPGKLRAASVKGFGIVFSDVDVANSTSLEFFTENKSLGKFYVPAKNGSNFSFLGVYFKNEKVTRIHVQHDGELDKGQKDISADGPFDLVTLDNFLYSEPLEK